MASPERGRVEFPASHPYRGASLGVLRLSAEGRGARSFEASPAGREGEGEGGGGRRATKNRLVLSRPFTDSSSLVGLLLLFRHRVGWLVGCMLDRIIRIGEGDPGRMFGSIAVAWCCQTFDREGKLQIVGVAFWLEVVLEL